MLLVSLLSYNIIYKFTYSCKWRKGKNGEGLSSSFWSPYVRNHSTRICKGRGCEDTTKKSEYEDLCGVLCQCATGLESLEMMLMSLRYIYIGYRATCRVHKEGNDEDRPSTVLL